MKPRSFDYVKAGSLDEALALLSGESDEIKLIAGGQSLVPTLNMRLSAPSQLIDISGLSELQGIKVDGGLLRVGALTRHAELQQSDLVAQHVPLVATAIEHVAHAAIRNRGTIGGNLAMADPASELPACALALNAELTILGKNGKRTTQARDYFKDLYETDLGPDEILLEVAFPVATGATVHTFREHVRRRGDFATTGLVIHAERDGDQLTTLAPVFFAVANTPVLAQETASHLTGVPLNEANLQAALQALETELEVIGDTYASAEMKMHLAKHYFTQSLEEIRG